MADPRTHHEAKVSQEAEDSHQQQRIEQAEREKRMRRQRENPEEEAPEDSAPTSETKDP